VQTSNGDEPLDLAAIDDRGLLELYGRMLDELRTRNMIRSSNNPVADYAEWLVARGLGLTLAGKSAAGYDAMDPSGNRYQIKGRRLTSPKASRQLGLIRALDRRPFDYLAAVLFNRDLSLLRASLIPIEVVRAGAYRSQYQNGWIFFLRDDVWAVEGVRDITAQLKGATG
jgi:hypothetical protein